MREGDLVEFISHDFGLHGQRGQLTKIDREYVWIRFFATREVQGGFYRHRVTPISVDGLTNEETAALMAWELINGARA